MYNINRRKFLGLFGCGCCSLLLPSCSTVPITERKQLSIIPEARINRQAAAAYENFRKKTKLINTGSQLKEIREIGKKIEISVSAFFANKKKQDPTKYFEWDYILVDNDKVVNAWCMPGGKIAVYTGLLKVTKNINALSIVMGHEIAHAVARHSAERMSRAVAVTLGTGIADAVTGGAVSRTRDAIGQITGVDVVDSTLMKPHGRSQESEADYMGLIFASLSGYDINESVRVWKRMNKKFGKKEFPEFLSTHPSTKTRILDLRGLIPEVRKQYPSLNI